MSFRPFTAKHNGTCVKCKAAIQPGQLIEGSSRNYSHLECPPPEDTGCLMCGQECKHQRINSVENADMENFLVDFDRGCSVGCKCDGLNYHIQDFCSAECLAEAAVQYEKEQDNDGLES